MKRRTPGSDKATGLLREAREELRDSATARRGLALDQMSILDAIPDHIALLDRAGVILTVNLSWRRFGLDNGLRSATSGVGENYLTLCDRATGEECEEALAAAAGIRSVLDGTHQRFSLDYPCHSAQARRWFRLVVTPMSDLERGGAVVVHQEVSEAKFAEFAAEEAADAQANLMAVLAVERARLVAAQAVAKVGSWETDFRNLETLWSAETFNIFGLDERTFHPTHLAFLEHCHPDDRAAVDAAFQASATTRDLCTIEHRIVLDDGSIKQVEERWRTHLDALGSPVRAVGTCQDVSERHATAMALAEGQALQRVAAQMGKIGGFRTDVATGIRQWSDELCLMDDRSPGDTPSLEESLTSCRPEDHERIRRLYAACASDGTPYDFELPYTTVLGRQIWLRIKGEAVRDPAGKIIAIQGAVQDISDRIASAAALEENQTLLRVATSLSKVGAFREFLADGRRRWSDEVCTIFGVAPGYTPDLAEALSFYLPEDRPQMRALFDACKRDGTPYDVELAIVTRTGRPAWIRTIGVPVRDASGHIIAVQGAVQDITERRAATEALLRSEERFRKTFDSAPVGMVIISIDGRITDANGAFCQMLGFPVEQLRGKPFLALGHPDDQAQNLADITELVEGGRQETVFERRFIDAEARTKWARISAAAPRDDAGRTLYLIGMVADITQEREAQESLRQSEERFRQTFDLAPMGIIINATDGRFTEANATFRRMMGYTTAELRGRSFGDLTHPDDRPASLDAMALLVSGRQESMTLEKRYLAADGRTIWARVSIGAPRDAAGQVLYFITAVEDITASRVAAEALRTSEERFRVVFEQAGIAIALVDASDGQIIRGNGALAAMLGYDLDELTRLSVEMISETTEYKEDREQWERLVRGEIPRYQMAKRYYRKDGKVLWGVLTCTLIRDEAGQPRFILGMVEDITREREAQQALAMSEERFRLLSMAANDGIYDWDFASNIVWRNDGFEELYGHTAAALGAAAGVWADLIHPDDRDRVIKGVRRAIESSAENWSAEYRFQRKDGSYAHVLDQGHIVRNAEGQGIRMIGAVTDLTIRKEGERRLAQQAALLDAAHDAILVKDMDDRITYWNKGAERSYGWLASEVIGRDAAELFHVEPTAYEAARALLLDRGQWEGDLIQRGKDGRPRDVSVRWSLMRNERGHPTSVLAISSDITERKRLELQFLRAQRLESLGTLAGGIAHDLNNVLAPILVSIELLREDDDDPERMESLATIEASAKRGAAMVQQVLTFARGVEGKRLPIDVARIARDVAKIARDTFPKGIVVRLNAPPGLWTVSADATQIHQVLTNLCVNARDAMPDGGTLTMTLTNVSIDEIFARMNPDSRRGPFVSIMVADTGMGIPPAVQERLFEPFFTTKAIGKGTGLGLSTVHSIVHSHKGFLDLYSELGKGARFTVYLPALVGTPRAPDAQAVAIRLPRGNGELVLVVDDEEAIRSIVQRTLERFGYRVLLAENGAEGVAKFAEQRKEIAVVLTDMAMPVMDGQAMVAALRMIDPAVRVIASSGLSSGGSITEALAAGITEFVSKPYTAETLLTTLHRVLHGVG